MGPRLLEVHLVCESGIVGSCGNVVVWLWHASPSDSALAAVRKRIAYLDKISGAGTAVIHLLPNPDGKMPNDEQRRKITKLRSDCAYSVRASAIVFEGDGIRSAIIRSLATAVMMASGSKSPQTIFRAPGPAVAWIRGYLPAEGATADELAAAILAIRSARLGLAAGPWRRRSHVAGCAVRRGSLRSCG